MPRLPASPAATRRRSVRQAPRAWTISHPETPGPGCVPRPAARRACWNARPTQPPAPAPPRQLPPASRPARPRAWPCRLRSNSPVWLLPAAPRDLFLRARRSSPADHTRAAGHRLENSSGQACQASPESHVAQQSHQRAPGADEPAGDAQPVHGFDGVHAAEGSRQEPTLPRQGCQDQRAGLEHPQRAR